MRTDLQPADLQQTRPPADRPAITCAGLAKSYGRTCALVGVDLQVERGSVFGFLGPNGAGKSTLVKILTGLVRPSAGEVRVAGGRPGTRPVQRRVGYLPEQFRFPFWLTGRELVELHTRLARLEGDYSHLLDLVGLGDAADRKIGEYSKGMQQRLGLAQALVGDPEIVFLDEPTSALDPLGRLDVRDILVHLRERGMTVFLNSHLLTEVERVCDRLAVIDHGAIIAQGTTDELLLGPGLRVSVGEVSADALARLSDVAIRAGWDPPSLADGVLRVPGVGANEVPDLIRILVEDGVSVYEAGLVRQTLEEAFVHLVREHQHSRKQDA